MMHIAIHINRKVVKIMAINSFVKNSTINLIIIIHSSSITIAILFVITISFTFVT